MNAPPKGDNRLSLPQPKPSAHSYFHNALISAATAYGVTIAELEQRAQVAEATAQYLQQELLGAKQQLAQAEAKLADYLPKPG